MIREPANKGRKLPAEVLTDGELSRLMKASSATCPTGMRNRALIALMARCGLRVAEALALEPKDLDLENGMVRVLRGKGAKARTVGIDPGAAAIVGQWLEMRKSLEITWRAPLLCTLKGRAMGTDYVRQLLPRLARRAGIEKRVHAHGLRHLHAAQLCREGVPVNVIQAQLGHSNLSTTSRYLQHVAPMELVETMQRREWQP